MSQGFAKADSDHGLLTGLSDDDHAQYLNTTRHNSEDHSTALSTAVIADLSDVDAWQTWSPSYTNLTIGNGTVTARYVQIGKTVIANWKLIWGSTTSTSTTPRVSSPVTPHSSYADGREIIGNAMLADVGTVLFQGQVQFFNTLTMIGMVRTVVSGANVGHGTISSTAPHTWTTGDEMGFTAIYEAA